MRIDKLEEEAAAVGKVNIINDVDVYHGETICDKEDSCVSGHPVVMIDRSWCLYSNE